MTLFRVTRVTGCALEHGGRFPYIIRVPQQAGETPYRFCKNDNIFYRRAISLFLMRAVSLQLFEKWVANKRGLHQCVYYCVVTPRGLII